MSEPGPRHQPVPATHDPSPIASSALPLSRIFSESGSDLITSGPGAKRYRSGVTGALHCTELSACLPFDSPFLPSPLPSQ